MAGQTLGFIGLGRMGGPLSSHLLEAGHSLCVFDTADTAMKALTERGAEAVASPQEVASTAEIVFLSLPTPPIVQAVVLGDNGIIHGSKVRTVVDLSTTGPSVATLVAGKLAEKDIAWVDSPVSGGIAGAVNATLAVMVSCPKKTYDEVTPLLERFGKLFFTGEKPGLAQVAKLGNNILAATAVAVSSEALAMGVKAGIDPRVMVDIINAGSGRNTATEAKFPKAILTGTFDFGFSTELSYKDARLCLDEAEALGVPMMVGAVVRQILAITNRKYGPQSDFTCIAKVIEDWAGVEIRG